ncbi:MAG: polysaccharide deacetylase family protein [Chitinivibrionales bacterium]|nr:polysaccharide deacetylase family protein [Chitinivibrionales bacterium]
MTQTSPRKRPRCTNHSRRLGRVRCALCGEWLCRECANTRGDRTVCRDRKSCGTVSAPKAAATHRGPGVHSPETLRRRSIAATEWSLVALLVVSMSVFPHSVREMLRLGESNRVLSGRTKALRGALHDSRLQSEQLRDELRQVKDSVLTVLAKRPATPPLSHRAMSTLRFDARLPSSLDNGNRRLRTVALTFDGESHVNAAREILDTLQSRDVRATMFLTGKFIERYPKLVRRMVELGHVIGNHTYSHPHLTTWESTHSHQTLPGITRARIFNELGRTGRAYHKVTGRRMSPLWRAPYGERNREICRWAQEAGYLHIGWRQGRTWLENLDTNDWVPDEDSPLYHSPREVIRKIMRAARQKPYGVNGGIVLMHIGTLRKRRSEQMHLSMGTLIDSLRTLGYSFTTVTDLAGRSGVDLALLQKSGSRELAASSVR